MTFSVVAVEKDHEKVVGTIWAEGEAQAQLMASNVYHPEQEQAIKVRLTEQRELPLRIPS